MRRIVLVLALTAVLVAVALASTAFAQVAPGTGCEGIDKAIEQQKTKGKDRAEPPQLKDVSGKHNCKE